MDNTPPRGGGDKAFSDEDRLWTFNNLIDEPTQVELKASREALEDPRKPDRLIIGYNPPCN